MSTPPSSQSGPNVEPPPPCPCAVRVKLAMVVLVTLVMATLVTMHVKGVNGPWYWTWSWRRLAWWPLAISMLVAAAPFVGAQLLFYVQRWPRAAVMMLAAATFALQIAAIANQPPYNGARLPAIVRNPVNTSYFTDAVIMDEQSAHISAGDWLLQYHDIVPLLHLHAKYKPPGLVLYYYAIVRVFGRGDAAAWVGGVTIALLAAASVPATFAMIRFFTRGRTEAAFCGASFLALCPSLVLFLPQFDQVYPLIACGILVTWASASRDGRWSAAIACGALLALGSFCSYIFLVLGCFMAVWAMLLVADRGPRAAGRAGGRAAGMGVVVLATVVTLYLLLHAATGFDPILTFQSIAREQAKDLLPLVRPFPQHIVFDLLDFAMGAGWIGALIAVFFVARLGRRIVVSREPAARFTLLATIQIATVAAAALLPGETARLWMLMLPLLMAPIGLELAEWPARPRMIAYACLWVMLVVICQNMTFIYMGPELDGPRS